MALAAAVAAVAGSACRSTAVADRPSPPVSGSYVVTKATDGDTIHVELGDGDERVRLIGVDTPEVGWYGGTAECFGNEAGLFTRRRLEGRRVRLAFDADRFDRYGRTLAYVYLGRELFNLTLVQRGYARADPVPPDTRMAAVFADAESQARDAGRGLWAACENTKK
jgi:micrococcal nuclease